MNGLTTQPWGRIKYLIALTFISIPIPAKIGMNMQLWWFKTKGSSSLAAIAAGSLVKLWKVSFLLIASAYWRKKYKFCNIHIANDDLLQVGSSLTFKMMDMEPVQSPTSRMSSSWLGAGVTVAIMEKWTGYISHHNNCHSPLFIPGMTLKANTWAHCATWQHLDGSTAAPVFWPVTVIRYPHVVQFSFFCISNRPCWLLEVKAAMAFYWPLRSSCLQTADGQAVETSPGDICFQII